MSTVASQNNFDRIAPYFYLDNNIVILRKCTITKIYSPEHRLNLGHNNNGLSFINSKKILTENNKYWLFHNLRKINN